VSGKPQGERVTETESKRGVLRLTGKRGGLTNWRESFRSSFQELELSSLRNDCRISEGTACWDREKYDEKWIDLGSWIVCLYVGLDWRVFNCSQLNLAEFWPNFSTFWIYLEMARGLPIYRQGGIYWLIYIIGISNICTHVGRKISAISVLAISAKTNIGRALEMAIARWCICTLRLRSHKTLKDWKCPIYHLCYKFIESCFADINLFVAGT